MVAVSRKGSAEWTLPAAACPRGRIEAKPPPPLVVVLFTILGFFFFFFAPLSPYLRVR